MPAALADLIAHCNQRLGLPAFADFPGSCNGLQIENNGTVTKIGAAVDAGLVPFQRAAGEHVDFLLVRSSDLAPLAGVELDDSSHEGADRKQRDAFVDDLFRSCALPILHVPAQAAYDQTELRAKIAAALGSPPLTDVK